MRRALVLLLLLPCSALAQINAGALILNIKQEQIQQSKLNAKTSDGRRDRTIRQVRVLDIETRLMGPGQPEETEFRWFFIGKSPVDGSFDYYSHGERDVVIPRRVPLRVQIVSDPLRQDKFVEQEFFTSIRVTAGSVPQGWVLWVLHRGSLVKMEASDPGLHEWMKRNPPPRKKP